MALRFARVLRYRDDKGPADADTIDTVRTLYGTLSANGGVSPNRHSSAVKGFQLMAAPTTQSDSLPRTTEGDITYVRTDADLPPVAIVDRSPITTRHKMVFAVIALLGAVAWAVIAFFRGETVSAVWFVIAAVCSYVVGYRFYARFIEMKIVIAA